MYLLRVRSKQSDWPCKTELPRENLTASLDEIVAFSTNLIRVSPGIVLLQALLDLSNGQLIACIEYLNPFHFVVRVAGFFPEVVLAGIGFEAMDVAQFTNCGVYVRAAGNAGPPGKGYLGLDT